MTLTSPLLATLRALALLLVAFAFAVIVCAGATKWLPTGAAGVDHIIVPIIAFPIVWITFALTLYGATRPARAWGFVGGVTLVHIGLIGWGFLA